MKEYDRQLISNIIKMDIGISENLKGFKYLNESVIIVIKNTNISVMQIYERIAENHNRSPVSIERTIRYAIEESFEKNKLNGFFPHSGGKPSNSEVIWTIAEIVKRVQYNI